MKLLLIDGFNKEVAVRAEDILRISIEKQYRYGMDTINIEVHEITIAFKGEGMETLHYPLDKEGTAQRQFTQLHAHVI